MSHRSARPPGSIPIVSIDPTDASARTEALTLLAASAPPEDREAYLTETSRMVLEDPSLVHLAVARDGSQLTACSMAMRQPGCLGVVWPPVAAAPRALDDRLDEVMRGLLRASRDWLADRGTVMAQVILPAVDEHQRRQLEAERFFHLADLLYLGCPAERFPAAEPILPMAFSPYCAEMHDRFARVVDATYEGTRDCPQLNGVRAIDDVLAGYRASGVFRPELWSLFQHGEHDVGCLFLADHPRHGNVELVYMGLLPQWRGRGWGASIVRQAQWVARRLQRERLVLAVDAENRPAIDAYAACGFEAWDRRTVYACRFSSER